MTPRHEMPETCILHADELKRIGNTVDDIHKRLFVDNGEPCLQSKIRAHGAVINALIWVVCVVITGLIALVVKSI